MLVGPYVRFGAVWLLAISGTIAPARLLAQDSGFHDGANTTFDSRDEAEKMFDDTATAADAVHSTVETVGQVAGDALDSSSGTSRLGWDTAKAASAAAAPLAAVATAKDVYGTSYACGTAAQNGKVSDCAGQAANTAASLAVGALADTGPVGAACAAGYTVGKAAQMVLSRCTGQPTLNDQFTDFLYDKLHSEDAIQDTRTYTEQEIAQGASKPGSAKVPVPTSGTNTTPEPFTKWCFGHLVPASTHCAQ